MVEDRSALQGWELKLFNLVCKGATPQQWAKWLRTPLEHAAAAGESKLVECLLRAGANGKSGWKGCNDRTLLCAAAEGGRSKVVSALLDAGSVADVNVSSGTKSWPPLQHAAFGGHESMGRVLLMAGADAKYVDEHRVTPLHLAVMGNHECLADDLLLAGASPNAPDKYGESSLYKAARLNQGQMVTALVRRGGSVNMLNTRGECPLFLAARHGSIAAAKALLAAGADPTLRTNNMCDRSPLDIAANSGNVEMLRVLVQSGANVDTHHAGSVAAIHYAAYWNKPKAVQFLIEAGANVNGDSKGWSPLHEAARSGACGAMLVLLRNDAKVHITHTATGYQPLVCACDWLQEAAADLLLRWSADEQATDKNGQTVESRVGAGLNHATRKGRANEMERMRKLLARAPADRSWRRRGMLVMYRARLASACCKQHVPVAGPKSTKWLRTSENRPSCGGLESSEVTTGGTYANEGQGVEEWVACVAQEDVFRNIMSFV